VIGPRILSRLVYFAAVAETQAFTRAAKQLGITKAVVSQQIARLERDLGTSLFVRTTRRVELTDTGRVLYERAVGVLQDAQDAIAETAQANSRPQGTLRIAAPNAYGTIMIVPAVTKFLSDYPDCRADLRFNDRIVDILAGEIDVAIRVGWLIDSSLRARRLGGVSAAVGGVATIRRRARRDEVPSRLGNASVCGKYGVARTQNVDLHQ
jgi:DNA-binding transcriptional LysR family regulator